MNVVDYLFKESKTYDKDLVLGNSETISYKKIYDHIIRTAHFLEEEVGEDNKILVMSNNSVFFIYAYFGIMKSGNICVPLDPTLSPTTLAHVIDECRSPVAFVQKKSEKKWSDSNLKILNEESMAEVVKIRDYVRSLEKEEFHDFDEKRLAEILYTSGSTALPKGVMLSHENIIANTDSIIRYLGLTSDDIMEVVLPFFYCYGLSLLHTHVKVGGSVVLNNSFILLKTVVDDLLKYRCTGFAGVPSHFQIMLRMAEVFKNTDFPHLKYVTQAGGKLVNTFIKEFVELLPNVKFYVMYGQTEATARLSYLSPDLVIKKLGSIGKSIPDVKLEVLNKEDKPVEPGKVGEIVASGKNIMGGYFKDEDLTKKVLRNGKLYTGDLATVDEVGYIYVVAREKEIIKVAGERVSPKEIEETIVSIAEVVDCSIIGVEDEVLGEAIKAFIVIKRNAREKISKEYILSYCKKRLPSHKVPKHIEFISKIPVSSTGKKTMVNIEALNT